MHPSLPLVITYCYVRSRVVLDSDFWLWLNSDSFLRAPTQLWLNSTFIFSKPTQLWLNSTFIFSKLTQLWLDSTCIFSKPTQLWLDSFESESSQIWLTTHESSTNLAPNHACAFHIFETLKISWLRRVFAARAAEAIRPPQIQTNWQICLRFFDSDFLLWLNSDSFLRARLNSDSTQHVFFFKPTQFWLDSTYIFSKPTQLWLNSFESESSQIWLKTHESSTTLVRRDAST